MNVALLGHRVKAGLEKGRAFRLAEQKAQAEKNMAMVFRLMKLEQEQGRSRRGMAVRIAHAMGHKLTDRRIRQIISGLSEPTTPAIARLLKGRQRFSNTDSPIWQGGLAAGRIEDVPAYSTTAMSSGKLLYGDFSNILIIDWGVLELDVDRSGARFNQGLVGIRAMWMVDMLVLHPESFAVIQSIT